MCSPQPAHLQLHARVQAKEQENSELMAMCDQLMALQEAGRTA